MSRQSKTAVAVAAAAGLAAAWAIVATCFVAPGCGGRQGGPVWREAPPSPGAARVADPPSPVPTETRRVGGAPPAGPAAPDVRAGWADDNAQFNRYVEYLDRFSQTGAVPLDVRERIVLAVRDRDGRSVPNCDLTVLGPDGSILCRRRTYADGKAMFFPRERFAEARPPRNVTVLAKWNGLTVEQSLDLAGPRHVELRFDAAREAIARAELDVAFVLDSTGSMGDEIGRLRRTLEAIHYQVSQMKPTPDVRLAMVLYRDRGDEYVTKVTPLTGDYDGFARQLAAVRAAGGGDYPEDLQSALAAAGSLSWRPAAVKLAFVLGDAPPHLDYAGQTTYVDFLRSAAARGIKLTAIGASGLDGRGEYVFRQLAQYTRGLFVFLTYGEGRQTSEANPTGVSHHTGDNWVSLNLDAIVVQSIARELAYLGDRPADAVAGRDYLQADAVEALSASAVLETLFDRCARQLADFSQAHLAPGTSAAVAAAPADEGQAAQAAEEALRVLGDGLGVAISRQACFKLVERDDLGRILDEWDLRAAFEPAGGGPRTKPSDAAPLPAELLVLYRLRPAGQEYRMFVKLVRVRTGEILSASMLKIDRRLLG